MAKRKASSADIAAEATAPVLRTGGPLEQTTIALRRQQVTADDGTTEVIVSYDLAEAPVPSKRYSAELCALDIRQDAAILAFGQRGFFHEDVSSLICLRISVDGIRRFLESSRGFFESVNELCERANIAEVALDRVETEPTNIVWLSANIIAAAYSGRESCIDCYEISPWEIRNLTALNADRLGIEPVVRVTLSTSLLRAVLTDLYSRESTIPEPAK